MSLKNRTFLAWCEPDHTYDDAIVVKLRYERQIDSYIAVQSFIDRNNQNTIRVFLKDERGEPIRGDSFVNYGQVFEIRFNAEPNSGRGMPWTQFNKSYGRTSFATMETPKLVQVVGSRDVFDATKESKRFLSDSTINNLESDLILVKSGNQYFGPFEVDDYNLPQIGIRALKDLRFQVGLFDGGFIQKNLLTLSDQDPGSWSRGGEVHFVPASILNSLDEAVQQFDWMPVDKVVDELILCLTDSNLSGSMEKSLRKKLEGLLGAQGLPFLSESRKQRLIQVLQDKDNQQEAMTRFVGALLENEEWSRKLIAVYETDHQESLEARAKESVGYRDRVQKLERDLDDKQREHDNTIRQLDEERKRKQQEIDSAKDELHQLQQSTESARQDFERKHAAKVEERNQEISALDKTCNELREEVGAGNEAIALRKKLSELKTKTEEAERAWEAAVAARDSEEAELQKKKDALESLKSEVIRISNEMKERTIPMVSEKLRSLVDDEIWTALRSSPESKPEQLPAFSIAKLAAGLAPDEIIDNTHEFLKNAGRKVSRNDVINYLVCLTQGFVTTFAGDPGAGKTSLCNLLAKALGLAGDKDGGLETRRFSEISVERGWASHKDFIGYFNPLSKRIEKSNAEVYDAFSLLSREAKEGKSPAPYFFLLDEANLSPIEHYWAPFLRLCDFDSTESRSFNLGGDEVYLVPETVRFLATVNFDHTTEPLSPRFLNRSWIIMLNPDDIGHDSLMAGAVENSGQTVSYESLRKAFPRPKLEDGEGLAGALPKWKDIQKCFEDAKCGIMPRSQKMVQDYVFAASKYMDPSAGKLAPLDYAVAQKILPLVGGNGDHVKKLVTDLRNACESSLPRSAELLQNMIERQENGFYQFFAH